MSRVTRPDAAPQPQSGGDVSQTNRADSFPAAHSAGRPGSAPHPPVEDREYRL